MVKARYLMKKIGVIKGAFHSRKGTIKDRSDKDLTKQKRLKEVSKIYRLYKKGLNDLDKHDEN